MQQQNDKAKQCKDTTQIHNKTMQRKYKDAIMQRPCNYAIMQQRNDAPKRCNDDATQHSNAMTHPNNANDVTKKQPNNATTQTTQRNATQRQKQM